MYLKGRGETWLRGKDLNLRPLGYEPNELPDCSTPHTHPIEWSRPRSNRSPHRDRNLGAVQVAVKSIGISNQRKSAGTIRRALRGVWNAQLFRQRVGPSRLATAPSLDRFRGVAFHCFMRRMSSSNSLRMTGAEGAW